ncbi:MAG: xylulokinase [Christensenellales bacterium]|jgi:xylulokinase
MYLIGVDIGTSATKSVLFDLQGRPVASASVEYPMYQPQMGWAEQDPEDWWRGTWQSIKGVLDKSGVNPRDVKGIGLSGQMHGMVLLDKHQQVLRRSIIWCDQRTQAECDQITDILGRDRLIAITANPALTGFTASKVMWVKNHEPEIFAKIDKVLLPKDYVRFRLTGEFASEVSDASGMQFLDVPKRQWSAELMEKLGLDINWLGKVYESYEISGVVTAQAAELTGLMPGTPVAGGAGDQAASAVGNGIVEPGIVSATIGTSGVVFAHSDTVSIDPKGRVHTFCHAVPGCWHMMGVTQGAGLSMQWFREQFGAAEKDLAARMGVDTYELLCAEAERAPAGSQGLIYLPYLMGERTPHLDSRCKGVYFGLTASHTRNDMIRATMEGVTYSLLDCMNIIRELGVSSSQVRAAGGGARSPLWRQMIADMFDCQVFTMNTSEAGALGVAILAGVGAGLYPSVPEACAQMVGPVSSVDPLADNREAYARFYPVYQALYGALKPQYDQLAQILGQ